MKRLISLVLLFCFLFVTACSDDSSPPRKLPTDFTDTNISQEDASNDTGQETDTDINTNNDTDLDTDNDTETPCIPETDTQLCDSNDAVCGQLITTDNCGTLRTIESCGTCEDPDICGALGAENQCGCTPPSITELCSKHQIECGETTVIDACGTARTIDCGSIGNVCTEEHETCGGGGLDNTCGCTPTTCQQANALCGQIPDGCGGTLECDYFCVDDLSAGEKHTCAVGSGRVKCWGDNGKGQLGDGTATRRQNPVNLQTLDVVTQIASGSRHTCALIYDTGGVVCWGDNARSQLGIGTTVDARKPGELAILKDATQVVSGDAHSCALVDGGVLCWGSNDFGQIGNLNVEIAVNVGRPLPVANLNADVKKIAAGINHTCALKNDGTVHCWGRNRFGQLGNLAPNFNNETISAWGYAAPSTQFNIDNATRSPLPLQVNALTNIKDITLGNDFSCALTLSDEVWCWGSLNRPASSAYQCTMVVGKRPNGDDITINAQNCAIFPDYSTVTDPNSTPIIKYTTNKNYKGNCASDGTCNEGFCNLDNRCELEDTYTINTMYTTAAALSPVKVSTATVQQMNGGANHLCMLIEEPEITQTNIQCLGLNADGQLGDGTTNPWPFPYSIFFDVDGNIVRASDLSLGERYSCAITGDSNVKCWGSNADGQIGNSALLTDETYRPFDVKIIYD